MVVRVWLLPSHKRFWVPAPMYIRSQPAGLLKQAAKPLFIHDMYLN